MHQFNRCARDRQDSERESAMGVASRYPGHERNQIETCIEGRLNRVHPVDCCIAVENLLQHFGVADQGSFVTRQSLENRDRSFLIRVTSSFSPARLPGRSRISCFIARRTHSDTVRYDVSQYCAEDVLVRACARDSPGRRNVRRYSAGQPPDCTTSCAPSTLPADGTCGGTPRGSGWLCA